MPPPRAPKKYLGPRRTQVSPEWLLWDEERQRNVRSEGWEKACTTNREPSTYFPERDGKTIPDDGAWIIVIEEPHTELKSRFRVPELSMWRARLHELNSGALTIGHGSGATRVRPKQAVITTPGGDLHLWPHEYVVASRPMELAGDPDATLHSLGGEPVLDEEELFYLMSRGISHHEAVMLLFAKITSLDFVYVTFPEEITSLFAGVGQGLR